jgi:peptidoglycan/xylan/chitin deacetylase (PgdA/CDA1 family)
MRMTRGLLVLDLAAKAAAFLLWPRAPLAAAILFFGPDLAILYSLLMPSSQLLLRVWTRFEPAGPEVCLTIDDGPDERDTPRLLDLLDRHGARAAFFVIGARAARHPELVAEMLRRGHEVGHHTQTHPAATFWCASPARLRAELDLGLAALAQGGAKPRWFRPPVGIKNLFLGRALAQRGLSCVAWSLRTRDGVGRDPARIAARALRRVRSGDILLMHEGEDVDPRVRVEAIALVLKGLDTRGLRCVIPKPEQLR